MEFYNFATFSLRFETPKLVEAFKLEISVLASSFPLSEKLSRFQILKDCDVLNFKFPKFQNAKAPGHQETTGIGDLPNSAFQHA